MRNLPLGGCDLRLFWAGKRIKCVKTVFISYKWLNHIYEKPRKRINCESVREHPLGGYDLQLFWVAKSIKTEIKD